VPEGDPETHRYLVGKQEVEGRFAVENVSADDNHAPPCIWLDGVRMVLAGEPVYDICTEPIPIWRDGDLAYSIVTGSVYEYTDDEDGIPLPPKPIPANVPNYMRIEAELGQGRPHPRPGPTAS
jgi:hypothetical protein